MKVTTKIELNGSANIFVIPNSALIPSKDCSFEPYTEGGRCGNQDILKGLRKMAELNGRPFDGDDYLVQVWYFNEESDNITDHRIDVMIGDETYQMMLDVSDYIPYSYLKNLHEGESITIKIPVTLHNLKSDECKEAIWVAELKAVQGEGCYRQFGKFENAVGKVVASADRLYADVVAHNFQFQDK